MTSTHLEPTLAERPGQYLQTRTGGCLRLRPVSVTDGRLLAEFFGRLSADDLRFRFLDARKQLTPADIAAMIEVDHRRHEHLLAFDTASGQLAGSLMIITDPNMEAAEVAVAVAAEYKGQGIGWTLLRHAADLARERGLKRLRSIESQANHEAIEVGRALGFRSRALTSAPGLVLLETELV